MRFRNIKALLIRENRGEFLISMVKLNSHSRWKSYGGVGKNLYMYKERMIYVFFILEYLFYLIVLYCNFDFSVRNVIYYEDRF